MRMIKVKLGRYFLITTILQFAIIIALMSVLIIRYIAQPYEYRQLLNIHDQLRYSIALTESHLDTQTFVVNRLANHDESGKNLDEMAKSLFVDENNVLDALVVLNSDWIVEAQYPNTELIGLNLASHFQNLDFSDEGIDYFSGDDGVHVVKRAYGKYYVGIFDLDLQDIFESDLDILASSIFYVTDGNGNVLDSNKTFITNPKYEVLQENIIEFEGQTLYTRNIVMNNEEYILKQRAFETLNMTFNMMIPIEVYQQATYTYQSIMAFAFGGVVLLSLMFYLNLRKQITIPLERLTDIFKYDKLRDMSNEELKDTNILEINSLNFQFKKLINQLIRKEQEMNEFVYIASHDLQEPLRVISSYINILEMDYEDKFDEDGHKYLNYVVDGAKRMKNLIVALLDYSRIINAKLEFKDTDLNEILKMVENNLEVSIKEKEATIISDDLPVVKAHEQAMIQLFQNLIANSIKFCKDKPEIQVRYVNNQLRFIDNGIGIAEEDIPKLFKPFKRLNSAAEYKGTGIGLAVVFKTCESHGWKVHIESELGKGTTFVVDLGEKYGS